MTSVVSLRPRSPKNAITILSSKQFAALWEQPNFVLDGILQRRFIYSITARAGMDKTAISLTLAAHVALGRALGNRAVAQGRVLYFAGENPDDIRTRWKILAETMGFDVDQVPVDFIAGAFPIEHRLDDVLTAAETGGPYAMVIVDTSAAYFSGDDENDNVQAHRHAATLRKLMGLPGGPCVIVAAHPPKGGKDHKTPRGGGGFINEIDGNTYLERSGNNVLLIQHDKFRGPPFQPLSFELKPLASRVLTDANGKPIKSVGAVADGGNNHQGLQTGSDRKAKVVSAMRAAPGGSLNQLAKLSGLNRSAVARELQKLKMGGITHQDELGHWHLTKQNTPRSKYLQTVGAPR